MKEIKTRAEVTEAFPGAKDGEVYPQDFKIGDVIEGDLARAAVASGKAKEIAAESAPEPAPQYTPRRRGK